MKHSFFQIWPIVFLIIILGVLVFYWRESTSLEQIYLERAKRELASRGRLLTHEIARYLQNNPELLQPYCIREGQASETRITVLDAKGNVLGDSQEQPAQMENHAGRPEFEHALDAQKKDGKPYSMIRYSTTLGQRLIYCAQPFTVNGNTYVLRTAFSVYNLDRLLRRSRWDIFWAVAITALAATVLSYVIFRTVSRPVRELCGASALIAAGNLNCRLPIPERGAIRELALSLSRMAEELKARINEISREKGERDAIFTSLAEGVVVLDNRGIILDINQAGIQMFELRKNPTGLDFSALVRYVEVSSFLQRLRSAPDPAEMEFSLEQATGMKQIRLRGSQLCWGGEAGSGGCGILLVGYDMTQIRKLENFRRDFVANVSHEIKTPLTVIQGAVETLRDGAINEPDSAARFMQIIDLHTQRLSSLVQDILSLSQLECRASGDGYCMIRTPVSLLVSTAVELAQSKSLVKGAGIRVEMDAQPEVVGDAQLLEQAIFNLVDNAQKHSGDTSEIVVHVYQNDEEAIIDVIDHGCGIPLEHQPRVFERFYRVDKARSRKAGGTGLGLAIVKHIVQLHHGTVDVKSTVGEGSTFTIRLPLCV